METIIKVLEEKKEQLNNIDTDTENNILIFQDYIELKTILVDIHKEQIRTNQYLEYQTNLLFFDNILIGAIIILSIMTNVLRRFI